MYFVCSYVEDPTVTVKRSNKSAVPLLEFVYKYDVG